MSRSATSTGRGLRLIVAGCHAPAGMIVMVAVLIALDMLGDAGVIETLWMITCAGIGAAAGGYTMAGFYGRAEGATGWFRALAGAILATALGSFIGGAIWPLIALFHGGPGFGADITTLLTAPFQAGLLGVMVVMGLAPAEEPLLVPFWLVVMLLVQVGAIFARQHSLHPDRVLSIF